MTSTELLQVSFKPIRRRDTVRPKEEIIHAWLFLILLRMYSFLYLDDLKLNVPPFVSATTETILCAIPTVHNTE